MELDKIEKECEKKQKGYVSRRHLELLQEVIIKTKYRKQLGITMDPQKGRKRKQSEDDMIRGRKTNKQRIAEVGVKLIELGQYPMIVESFTKVNRVNQ